MNGGNNMKVFKMIPALILAAMLLFTAATAESVPDAAALDPVGEVHTLDDLPWYLTFVNASHAVPEDRANPELTTLKNDRQVDSRIYPQLQAMFDAARKDGIRPMVMTAYRTYDDQKSMLIKKYRQYKKQGLSKEKAQEAALKVAMYPGYSEHQLGLAVDIDSANTEKCSNDRVWTWMKKHCAEYGFIWRYPGSKSDITGINNESWHFRYVGVEAATYIMENELCFEEYLQQVYHLEL